MPLTDIQVRNAKPTDKAQKLFDGNGLFLFISPSGTKSWRLKYRIQGREKLFTFGVYPQISLREAREACFDVKKLIRGGIDPAVEKKLKLEQPERSFENIAREWHSKRVATWSSRHADDVMERLEKNIFPFLGTLHPNKITPPQLLAVIRKIEARGAIEVAHRVRGICSQVFRYAIAIGISERDPAADLIGALQVRSATPRAAITDPKAVGALMRALDSFNGTYVVKCALQLNALTFCRPGEIRSAEWAEFDFEESLWRIPAAKMKMRRDHIVPLSTQTLALVSELRKLTGGGRYLFPSIRTNKRPISDITLVAGLRRMGYEKNEMCAHGFRAMASTLLNELGYEADYIEKQLAHNPSNKIRGIYNRAEYLPERRKMMQKWADYLDELKGKL